ncbi:phthiocerol/phenolphthiocerol synthesis type-I polyketide synthase E [Thermoflexales bacterium]|nr:phthiocerol/phenolphthiocerol synthesis type-I polyketide synthase E [Thermoflexales bacterium]
MSMSSNKTQRTGLEIAVIGLACHFPGANTVEAFWQNLREGRESISVFSPEELADSGEDYTQPNYVPAAGILEDVEQFDAAFFNLAASEAEIIDPQHRVFLECAWEAIERAGYNAEQYPGLIGVYAGVGVNSYLLHNLSARRDLWAPQASLKILISSDKDFLATRVSYKLNLRGPSITVQTACSSSLVAVHLASQSLLGGECEMALAGGVTISVPQRAGYVYHPGDILASDGHCRAFDARADGSVGGSGVGIVVLKRLDDALRDSDHIHAVILGTAVNNDGSLKMGYTAPSVDGQALVIQAAQNAAGIEPDTISYIEAHGSGTEVGDPIEIAALTQAFRARSTTKRVKYCALGSVKTNIGHLDTAAGVAGLIKTTLALEHKQIPPSLHFEQPNPQINFEESPFYVNNALQNWETGNIPRRAGVSSFGLGGTNAHVILEEAPPLTSQPSVHSSHLLLLSARTPIGLERAAANLTAYFQQHSDTKLADVAYTYQVGRKAFPCRLALICRNTEEAMTVLKQRDSWTLTATQNGAPPSIVFMFPGVGDHYAGMANELYHSVPTFHKHIEHCLDILASHLNLDLRSMLFDYPLAGIQDNATGQSKIDLRALLGRQNSGSDEDIQDLDQPQIVQLAIFIIEYALAQMWIEWGIYPEALIGHSLGEYVAACLASIFSLEDALRLVAKRAQLIATLSAGRMLAVSLSPEEVAPFLSDDVSLAAINGPTLCVISGSPNAMDVLEQQLVNQGIACRPLRTTRAFHSAMIKPASAVFTDPFNVVRLNPPQIPCLSNVTGTWLTPEEACNPNYWVKQMCQTVRFSDGIAQLFDGTNRVLLEVGPGQNLGSYIKTHPAWKGNSGQIVLASLRARYERKSDWTYLLETLGRLWLVGAQIDWTKLHAGEQRQRVPLPTYPFERQRYWLEPLRQNQSDLQDPASGKKPNIADWFYVPSWKRTELWVLPPPSLSQPANWLIFLDDQEIGSRIARRLRQAGHTVSTVEIGQAFIKLDQFSFRINPRDPDEYCTLLQELQACNGLPTRIVHAWSIVPQASSSFDIEFFHHCQDYGFYSLLFLAQALIKAGIAQTLTRNAKQTCLIDVLSSAIHAVTGEEFLCAESATILGPCKTIRQEYPNITCRNIDLAALKPDRVCNEKTIDQIMRELYLEPCDLVVAYRGNHRWLQSFEPVRLNSPVGAPALLRKNGVYLITGGMGRDSLVRAKYLAQAWQAKLVLIGRTVLPARTDWGHWLATHSQNDPLSLKIKNILELEDLGSEVMLLNANVAHEEQMRQAIKRAEERFGQICGVIHAAGLTQLDSSKLISEMKYADCEAHFQTKACALFVLEKVLSGRNLDFCIMTSSITAITGGLGLFAYAAASIFMDTFTHRHNRTDHSRWTSVNWQNLPDSEAVEVFQRIWATNQLDQLLISPEPLQRRIEQWTNPKFLEERPNIAEPSEDSLYMRAPNLATPYVAPATPVQEKIASMWRELFKIQRVGINDSFFELGGNSLFGIQLISRVRESFGIELPVRSLFELHTVAELATAIESLQDKNEQEQKRQIFEAVESLSDEEVEHELQKRISGIR